MTDPQSAGDPPAGLSLSTAEWALWQAFRNGSTLDLRSGRAEHDDPNGDAEWGPERTVRARVVALLLLHGPAALLGRVTSLHLVGAQVRGCLDLSGGGVDPFFEFRHCRFEDEVRMPEAHVRTGRFVDCYLPRLEAARLTTEGDLHLPRCSIPSGIRLTDAVIGTDLLLNQATIGSAPRDGALPAPSPADAAHRPTRLPARARAIAADGISVGQELQASLLRTDGEVSLRGATIGSSLEMLGTVLRNRHGRHALYAPQLTVEQTASFADAHRSQAAHLQGTPTSAMPVATGGRVVPRDARWRTKRFECTGGMVLDDGRFGSALMIENARFVLQRDQELSLRRITAPELAFTPQPPERGLVVLSGATVEKLLDRVGSWPDGQRLWMAGFSYRHAIPKEGHFNVRERLAWVASATPEYSPEPYEQLATVYRQSGEDTNARTVLLAKQRRRRETLPLVGKVWGYLQDWTVAYGYRPAQAAVWMAVLWASGALWFAGHPPTEVVPEESPQWNAPLYALDLLLPVISFGQDTAWDPPGNGQWVAALMIVLGWTLATTVAAGATRLLRRQ